MYINRYRDKIEFIPVGDPIKGLFQLKITSPQGQKFYPQRFGMTEDGHMTFVDPSGGPFIALGTDISKFDTSLPESIVVEIFEKDKETYLQCKTKS